MKNVKWFLIRCVLMVLLFPDMILAAMIEGQWLTTIMVETWKDLNAFDDTDGVDPRYW
jgi:hypothetical protein